MESESDHCYLLLSIIPYFGWVARATRRECLIRYDL